MNTKIFQIESMRPRDYTIVGISAVFDQLVSKGSQIKFGRSFKEIVSVLKNGQYYHGESPEDRVLVSKAFLKRVNTGQIDLYVWYRSFEKTLKDYEKLLKLPVSKYRLETIKEFYEYYRKLINVAYVAMETLDVISTLQKTKRRMFKTWVTKARLRGEKIYKDGETIFIPKYLEWLSKNYFPKYPAKFLSVLFFRELLDFIEKRTPLPSLSELQKRRNFFYLSQFAPSRVVMASGNRAKKIIEKRGLFQDKQSKDIKKLKGQIAYRGKVTGRVSLIMRRKDIPKYKIGDIIVSPMTDPSYLSIMKQSPAFITDEGGVLCHAAIVARELKKPCIIGTKIATKVFKNGDLVEVDANKGTVRKI